jgi:alginate O-acetyltransferase complex protein AlgI
VSAYLPLHLETVWLTAAVLLGTLLLGFGMTGVRPAALARSAAWALVGGGVGAVEWLTRAEPAGFRMLALILALLWGLKAVVAVESWAAGQPRLTLRQWLAFATLWLGMRPALFAAAGGTPRPGAGPLIVRGLRRLALGVGFVALARLVWLYAGYDLSETVARVAATAALLVGLSLILHFGMANLMAGAWRLAGVDCRSLFRAPLSARSLGEFWGQRWNLAFTEMTAQAVYRPLAGRGGKGLATLAAFLFSGVLHELAISVPVRAGYGLPLCYFTLHGVLVLFERHLERKGRPIERAGWLARPWTLGWLAFPLPLLFHPPFLRGVVWPLIGME